MAVIEMEVAVVREGRDNDCRVSSTKRGQNKKKKHKYNQNPKSKQNPQRKSKGATIWLRRRNFIGEPLRNAALARTWL